MFIIIFPLTLIIAVFITLLKSYLMILTDNIIISVLLFVFFVFTIILLIKFEEKSESRKNNFTYKALNILFSIFSLMLLSLSVFSGLSFFKII